MKLSLLCSTTIGAFAVRAFMNDFVETVVIQGEGGPVRINKVDYNETKHKLHKANKTHDENGIARKIADDTKPGTGKNDGGGATKPTSTTVELSADVLAEHARINAMKFGVLEENDKFYVVDANNENKRVESVDGIDNKKGYKSNAEAWKAVFAVQARVATGAAGTAS